MGSEGGSQTKYKLKIKGNIPKAESFLAEQNQEFWESWERIRGPENTENIPVLQGGWRRGIKTSSKTQKAWKKRKGTIRSDSLERAGDPGLDCRDTTETGAKSNAADKIPGWNCPGISFGGCTDPARNGLGRADPALWQEQNRISVLSTEGASEPPGKAEQGIPPAAWPRWFSFI